MDFFEIFLMALCAVSLVLALVFVGIVAAVLIYDKLNHQ